MLADYTARNATAAGQMLANFDETGFKKTLSEAKVGVAWDDAATRSAEGRATLDLAVRLLARLYPSLALSPLDKAAAGHFDQLKTLAKNINPKISIRQDGRRTALAIVVGRTPVSARAQGTFYVGSEGWIAKISRKAPVGSGRSKNPLGAGAAASLAVANIFRAVFNEQLGSPAADDELQFSLLAPNTRSSNLPNPSIVGVDVGTVHIVGLGAIGNGIVWALAQSTVKGTFLLIDKEPVDLGNLQRYAMAFRNDEGRPKAEIAALGLKARGRTVVPHAKTWAAFLDEVPNWNLDQVLVALDTANDRMAVQASIPRWIANGWTRGSEAGLSVHSGLAGGDACLACLYLPSGQAPNEDKIIADAIGITDVMEVRRRLDVGLPMDEAFLSRIAQAKGVPLERLSPFLGKSLRDFYGKAICGGQILEFSEGQQQLVGEVPMAFQSAFAGIMVAAELVARHVDRPAKPNLTQVDLLRRFPDVPSQRRSKAPDTRCLCQDPDYLAAYSAKYQLG